MIRKMLINAEDAEESRVAIVAEGLLEEFDIETTHKEQIKGNIYKGVVVKVEAGLQAAVHVLQTDAARPAGECRLDCRRAHAGPVVAHRHERVGA